MRIQLLFFFILFLTVKSFSQSAEFYQSDSIYKANGIKSRTFFFNWDKTNWRTVDHFNRNGQVIEQDAYDTSGRRYMSRTFSEYDSITGVINKQVIYVFGRYDTMARKMIQFSKPDTLTARFEYDSLKRLIRKTLVRAFGKKVNSIYECSYDPYIVTEKYYDDDGTWFEAINYYDEHFMVKKMVNTTHKINEGPVVNTYYYKNLYDKSGKIIRRTIKTELQTPPPRLLFKLQEYQYMSSGLITRRTNYLENSPGMVIMELFDYKFW